METIAAKSISLLYCKLSGCNSFNYLDFSKQPEISPVAGALETLYFELTFSFLLSLIKSFFKYQSMPMALFSSVYFFVHLVNFAYPVDQVVRGISFIISMVSILSFCSVQVVSIGRDNRQVIKK